MEYKKTSITKLIFLLLSLAITLSLCACGGNEERSSEDGNVSATAELSVEAAKALLEQDKLITEMFVCNSLLDSSSGYASRVTLPSWANYSSFSEIEKLLASTYTSDGKQAEIFLSYPTGLEPAVSSVDGKTSVFCHAGSGYTEFADMSTVAVRDTDNENIKIITAKTENGKVIELRSVFSNGVWLLEKGIYSSYPPANIRGEYGTMLSDLGSLSVFEGKILVIELFVSDYETEFTEAEEASFHQKIQTAVSYISETASEYGTYTEIEYESLYFDHSGTVGDRVLDFDIIFAETGFGTLKAFAEANYDLSQYDNYFFVVCLNKPFETDYSVYESTTETEIYTAEKVVVGAGSTDTEICVSILKLLGAYGYNEGKCDEYTEKLYKAYFPNDVMSSETLQNAEISPVTAYTIGITKELEPLYCVFIY